MQTDINHKINYIEYKMTGWFLTYEQSVVCYRLKERKFQGLGRKFLRQEFQKALEWPSSAVPASF